MSGTSEVKLSRAISVSQLESMKFNEIPFEGAWEAMMGRPELGGSWLIWGDSGNGKTRFALQLCKYLALLGYRVAYDSLEEGASVSMKKAFKAVGMSEVKRKVILLDSEPVEDLKIRLRKRRSPEVVVIDSVQYSGLNYRDYTALRKEFKNKLFILISHADGRNPSGRTAKSIRYDAFVKIHVEGYRAFALSRYGGGQPYTIWKAGAEAYRNEDL
ncbi:hypothetical protein [uncultured Draconibacterium sp.]|uniref:hypothetical protein n=1 Tax=uncultured Draconibacterium sp. TaxID=1573823 RepID=UPI0025D7E2A7|nr:hypothetical protein [uncultured Draconibacterium sp.]